MLSGRAAAWRSAFDGISHLPPVDPRGQSSCFYKAAAAAAAATGEPPPPSAHRCPAARTGPDRVRRRPVEGPTAPAAAGSRAELHSSQEGCPGLRKGQDRTAARPPLCRPRACACVPLLLPTSLRRCSMPDYTWNAVCGRRHRAPGVTALGRVRSGRRVCSPRSRPCVARHEPARRGRSPSTILAGFQAARVLARPSRRGLAMRFLLNLRFSLLNS